MSSDWRSHLRLDFGESKEKLQMGLRGLRAILSKSHKASSGQMPTSTLKLRGEPPQVLKAFVDTWPHFDSLMRIQLSLPQVTPVVYEVLANVNG